MSVTISFTEEELAALKALLQSKINETMVEVRHTATRSFKLQLQHRLGILNHLLSAVTRVEEELREPMASPT